MPSTCVITVKLAEAAALATGLLVNSFGGAIVASVKGAGLPSFIWNGMACLMRLNRDDDGTERKFELPDLTAEIQAIHDKGSKVGKIHIHIEIEPYEVNQ